jgi:hypothetical protein
VNPNHTSCYCDKSLTKIMIHYLENAHLHIYFTISSSYHTLVVLVVAADVLLLVAVAADPLLRIINAAVLFAVRGSSSA